MAAFTFYGTSLKGFRAGFGLKQGLADSSRERYVRLGLSVPAEG